MILQTKNTYETHEDRLSLARFLTTTISGDKDTEPYKKNESDDTCWTIDHRGNNWSLKFFHDKPNQFEFWHRYQCPGNPFERALAHWLVYTLQACIVPEPIVPSGQILVLAFEKAGNMRDEPREGVCRFAQDVVFTLEGGDRQSDTVYGLTEAEVLGRGLLIAQLVANGQLSLRFVGRHFALISESAMFPKHNLL